MESASSSVKSRGRPRSFDRTRALEAAKHLFWTHGYEGTSIADLTRAMGVTPPSLYAAFGDKRRLFVEAVHDYLGGVDAVVAGIAEAPSGRQAAHGLLIAAAEGDTGELTPSGCLLASSIVTSAPGNADVREEVAALRRRIHQALIDRIEVDRATGRLRESVAPEALADLTFALVQGMSTLAKDGANRTRLLGLIELAMSAWPEESATD